MVTEKRTERVSIILTPTELCALDLAAQYAQLEHRDFVRRIVPSSVRSVVAST